MAITNVLKEFVISGVKDLRFYDSNGDLSAEISKLTDININDETAKSELRGGLGNPVLLTIYGDRTCTLTATNSTMSMDLLKILTGNTVTIKSVNVPRVEKALAITSNSVTLAKTPATGANVTVYMSNAYNENVTKLTKTASAPTAGQFSITGTTITLASGTTGTLNVYYFEAVESEVLEAIAGARPIFKANAKVLLQSISNKKLYMGDIMINACNVSPSISFGGKNSSDTPDPATLELELLSLNDIAPYIIAVSEISSTSDLL
jgi:hypothetical protein